MNKLLQSQIIADLGSNPMIDPVATKQARVQFLQDYTIKTHTNGYVLGISGGVDSTTAGVLCQAAADQLTRDPHGREINFTAVRLPYGEQRDEVDAQSALSHIKPDQQITINIKDATDALMAELVSELTLSAEQYDFIKGNVKARMRMIAQYAVAGALGSLVVGTDHAAEALMGFFTKHGDGACDIAPLTGLTKNQVRDVCRVTGAPQPLWEKPATADLEDLRPGLLDEDAFDGVTYDEIDTYLQGGDVSLEAEARIVHAYYSTAHKRALPVTPFSKK